MRAGAQPAPEVLETDRSPNPLPGRVSRPDRNTAAPSGNAEAPDAFLDSGPSSEYRRSPPHRAWNNRPTHAAPDAILPDSTMFPRCADPTTDTSHAPESLASRSSVAARRSCRSDSESPSVVPSVSPEQDVPTRTQIIAPPENPRHFRSWPPKSSSIPKKVFCSSSSRLWIPQET